jgi:N-methylhydantoinase A
LSESAASEQATHVALGIDIGGTFTDVVLAGPDGRRHLQKILTTDDDPARAVLAGVAAVLAAAQVEPAAVARVVHATTLATNVVLQRRGASLAFVTTRGFRHLFELGRQARVEADRYDLLFERSEPPVPLSLCFEVDARMGADGMVTKPLDDADLVALADRIAATAVESVAICLLHSYANPDHEDRVVEALRRRLPADVLVVASSQVCPEPREFERAATTVVSATVGPIMSRYLTRLATGLRDLGVTPALHVMESGGGVVTAAAAAAHAVRTVESGPAAGVVAARHAAGRSGETNVLAFDMGGTTAKASVVRDGRIAVRRDFQVGGHGSFGGRRAGTGLPVKIAAVDLAEVGSGGGSIAWVDDGGALRVGPHSAGANPGPACYGLGGHAPTVTDADVVLGYVDPVAFASGELTLQPALAGASFDPLARELGAKRVAVAAAVHELANAAMGFAVQVVTVQRGIDPRGLTLVASGGAGPVHGARVAERFDMSTVLVPRGCGVGSALGLLVTDLVTSRSGVWPHPDPTGRLDQVEARFAALTHDAQAELTADQGVIETGREVDLRYRRQGHEITVPLPPGPFDADRWKQAQVSFEDLYRQEYGSAADSPIELVGLRVRVTCALPRLPTEPVPAVDGPAVVRQRSAWFAETGWVECDVVDWQRCRPGHHLDGPVLIEDLGTTVVVPPTWQAQIDETLAWRLTRSAEPREKGH